MRSRLLAVLIGILFPVLGKCELIYTIDTFAQLGVVGNGEVRVSEVPDDINDFTFVVHTEDISGWDVNIRGSHESEFGASGAIITGELIATQDGLFLTDTVGNEFTLADLDNGSALVLRWGSVNDDPDLWQYDVGFVSDTDDAYNWSSFVSSPRVATLSDVHVNEPTAWGLIAVAGCIVPCLIRKR